MREEEDLSVYDYAYILFFLRKYVGKDNIRMSSWGVYFNNGYKELNYSFDEIKKNIDDVRCFVHNVIDITINDKQINIASDSDLLDICKYFIHSKLTMPILGKRVSFSMFINFINNRIATNKKIVDIYDNEIDPYDLGEYNLEIAHLGKPYDHPDYQGKIRKNGDKFIINGRTFNSISFCNVYWGGNTIPQYTFFGFRRIRVTDFSSRCQECHCGFDPEIFSTSNMLGLRTYNGNTLCLQDYLWNARVCERCCCQYITDGNEDHEHICPRCYEDVEKYKIRSYHHNPKIRYYDYNEKTGQNEEINTNVYEFKGYGIELEVGKAGQKDEHSEETIKCLRDEVYAMRDGSINRDECLGGCDYDCGGFEIITFPHTERALYEMNWKGAFKYLLKKGYRSHDIKTCGLHIHISRTLLTDNGIINMMYFYENWWNDIIKFSRRQDREAQKWAGKYLSDWFKGDKRAELENIYWDVDKCDDHDIRYKAVNIQNRDTVEIRIMRGTLKLSTFLATLDFMITIAKNANHIDDVTDIKQWLVGMKTETYQYMAERKCFGYDEDGIINEDNQLEENIKEEEIE